MRRFEQQLPEDLREIAERLSAARTTLTPLEDEALRARVSRRIVGSRHAPRSGDLAGVLRRSWLASLLSLGLMISSAVGVVLAASAIGGGSRTFAETSFRHDHDASFCQTHGPFSETPTLKTSHGSIAVILVWDCSHLRIHFFSDDPFRFRFGTAHWNNRRGGATDTVAPTGATALTVSGGGSTTTLPLY